MTLSFLLPLIYQLTFVYKVSILVQARKDIFKSKIVW